MQRPWFECVSLFLIIAILAGFWIFSENLITTIDAQAVEIASLRDQVRQKEELLSILRSPRIELVALKVLTADSLYGKIIGAPETMTAIRHVSSLPSIAEDKDYQLWIIRNKKPESVGVFEVRDEKKRETVFKVMGLNVPNRKDVDAFAVTLETKGGVKHPANQMYLLGKTR